MVVRFTNHIQHSGPSLIPRLSLPAFGCMCSQKARMFCAYVPFPFSIPIPVASLRREGPGNIHLVLSLLRGRTTSQPRVKQTRGTHTLTLSHTHIPHSHTPHYSHPHPLPLTLPCTYTLYSHPSHPLTPVPPPSGSGVRLFVMCGPYQNRR